MKYAFAATLMTLSLVACTDKKATTEQTEPVHTEQTDVQPKAQDVATAQAEQVINFTGPNDLTLELKSNDNFETAQLTDNSDATYQLKRAVSASGVRLANDEGVSIHFKNFNGLNEGSVELVKDKPIDIKEFKADN